MNIDHIYITHTHSYDEEINIVNGFASIRSFIMDGMLEEDEGTKIGFIRYHFYNTFEFDDDISVVISADAISGDEEYMIHTLLRGDHEYELDHGGKVVSLGEVVIDERYYSEELECLVLQEFIRYCSYMMFDYMVVIAAKPVYQGKVRSVVEFPQIKMYEDMNFVHLGGSEKRAPVMVRNLNLLY